MSSHILINDSFYEGKTIKIERKSDVLENALTPKHPDNRGMSCIYYMVYSNGKWSERNISVIDRDEGYVISKSRLREFCKQIDNVEAVVIGNYCNKMALVNYFDDVGTRIKQQAIKLGARGNLIRMSAIKRAMADVNPLCEFKIKSTNKYTNDEYVMLDNNESILEINVTTQFDTVVKTNITNLPLLNYDEVNVKNGFKFAYYKERPTSLSDVVNVNYLSPLKMSPMISDKFGVKRMLISQSNTNLSNYFDDDDYDILVIHLTTFW